MGTKQAFDRKILFFIALLIFCAAPVVHGQGLFEEAQEEPEEKEQGSEKKSGFIETSSIEFNGYVRGDLYVGKVNEKDVTEIKSGYAEAAAKLKAKMGKWGDGRAEIITGPGPGDLFSAHVRAWRSDSGGVSPVPGDAS